MNWSEAKILMKQGKIVRRKEWPTSHGISWPVTWAETDHHREPEDFPQVGGGVGLYHLDDECRKALDWETFGEEGLPQDARGH